MPLTAIKVAFTHCDQQFHGAYFIPRITESEKLTSAAADFLYEEAIKSTMDKLTNQGLSPRKAHSNIFGTFLASDSTVITPRAWHDSASYLELDSALPVTAWTYWYMLEVLPPQHWRNIGGNNESFQCMEHMCGNVTSTFIKQGNLYWHVYANMGADPDEIHARLVCGVQSLVGLNDAYANTKTMTAKCSCCGALLPKARQWPNRDTNWSLCDRCIPMNSRGGSDLVELMDLFGIPGFHFNLIDGV